MGVLLGFVVFLCIIVLLVGILMFIVIFGDVVIGFLFLYLLSMGMGLLMILFVVIGGKLLFKVGVWMDVVKYVFGFVLFLVFVYFVSCVVDEIYINIFYVFVGMVMMGYLYVKNVESVLLVLKGVRFVVFVVGFVVMMGFVVVQFVLGMFIFMFIQEDGFVFCVEFEKIDSELELQVVLNDVKMNGQVVMLDFYVDWCLVCIQYEKNIFMDFGVVSVFFLICCLQIDMFENLDWKNVFQNEMNIVGLLMIVFVDQEGQELEFERVMGYLDVFVFELYIEKVVKLVVCQVVC